MAVRPVDANALHAEICKWPEPVTYKDWVQSAIANAPTLTPSNVPHDLISRSALLRGETEPEIITGSDSELAEHMEWDRWMDKIKRAPAVDKEGLQ